MADRAAFYVDGFNLYHAIDNLQAPHLKWLDLWALGRLLIPQESEMLVKVVYCSAFATHMPDKMIRHRAYTAALRASGVDCVMGNFKKRPPTTCKNCGRTWTTHEEKESDVNLAIHLIDDAHLNIFDHAYLITSDSDLAAAVRMFRQRFPTKYITTVAPPNRRHAGAIAQHSTNAIPLKVSQIHRCLFPEEVRNADGVVVATRPTKYDLPV